MTVVLLRIKCGWGSVGLFFKPLWWLVGVAAFEEGDKSYLNLHVPMFVAIVEIKHPPMTMLPEGGAA